MLLQSKAGATWRQTDYRAWLDEAGFQKVELRLWQGKGHPPALRLKAYSLHAFAFQLDKDGKPGQPFGAYKRLENGGRIVVLGEGMASLFLGDPNGVRLSGSLNQQTTYWGKDSAVFMEEVLTWLSR